MAEQLKPISIAAPGFYGLNLQDAPVGLQTGFALTADNCVIDSYGRIGARKGWTPVNAVNATLGTSPVVALHEFTKIDGSLVQLSVGANNIFTGTSTLTSIYNGSAWTASNWKVTSFNGKALFFQRGHDPLAYDGTTIKKLVDFNTAWTASAAKTQNAMVVPTVSNGYYYLCTTAGTTAASQPTWPTTVGQTVTDGTVVWTCKQIPQANEVLAAYGRIWVADTTTDKVTVSWSDTLIPHAFSAGASGSLDTHLNIPDGTDSIVALAAFNGFLVILLKNSILIFQGAKDPSTMSLYDVIDGLGCISRDSVQDIGSDLIFLSNRGLQSLARIVQEKSAPITNLSKNVNDQLLADVSSQTDLEAVKSAYYPRESMYLLTFPYADKVYCFDLRSKLDDGALRVTTWSGQTPTAFCTTKAGLLYMGKPGYIGKYSTYSDNGSSYLMSYFTSHMDAGAVSYLKFLKKLGIVLVGGSGATVRFKYILDYQYQTITNVNSNALPAVAEYNIAEYGIAEYNTGNINRLVYNIGGSGKVFQIGVEMTVNGGGVSIQQMDVFYKQGKEY